MKQCAYCESSITLTKEHIWPNCIIKKYEKGLITFNGRVKKFYIGDPLIKDVCGNCNNRRLSLLDSYLGNLFDDFLSRALQPGEKGTIEYNFELLLRSLLKISFNSSRAHKETECIRIHKRFSDYILKGGYRPRVIVKLQIVTTSKMIVPDNGTEDLLEPYLLRCGNLDYPGPLSHRFIVRMVAINSFWFYLIISKKKETDHKWKKFIEAFNSRMILPGVWLNPNSEFLEIPVEKTTYMHPDLLSSMLHTDHGPLSNHKA